MKTLGCFGCLALAAAAFGAGQPGVKPRLSAADYPAHNERDTVAVGAAMLTPEQVQGSFSTDLNRGYLVVEVGVYPKGGKVDLGPGDFTLRVAGTHLVSRPVAPRAIASVLQKSASKDRDITLYPTVGVGYESGPSYDPVYGTRRGGGVTTGAGVGVGVGDTRQPASTDDDRKTMQLELGDQQLPERVIDKPVAGYLYFPLPTRKKGVAYELEYNGPAGNMVIPLPAQEVKAR